MTLSRNLTGQNLNPFFRGDRLSLAMAAAQQLVDRKPVDLDFVMTLPEAKCVPLLSILTQTDFEDLLTFRDQIASILEGLTFYPGNLISYRDLARTFSCSVGSVAFQIQRLNGTIRPNGRPRLLTPEAYQMVITLVSDAFKKREPISIVYIIEQIQLVFSINVSLNTMAHIVKQMPGLKTVKGIPMERTRVMANDEAIDAYYERVSTLLPGIPRAFVVNADESGFADYTDARPETVVVPSDYPLDHIFIPADRSIKRSTLVAAIAADGTGLKPLIIVPRLTIEREVGLWGYQGRVIFKYQEHGFVTITIFEEWVDKVLLPYYADQRRLTKYPGWGLLILDGCTCHSLASLEVKLIAHKIFLVPLPPHSSDQTQPLDLGVFAAVKRYYMNPINVRTVSVQSSQVMRIVDAWIRGTIPRTIVNSFREAGFVPYEGPSGVTYLHIDKTAAKKVRHWTEAPHIAEGMGPAGRERVRLVEKRPNSEI
jgi:hypothetical protein